MAKGFKGVKMHAVRRIHGKASKLETFVFCSVPKMRMILHLNLKLNI